MLLMRCSLYLVTVIVIGGCSTAASPTLVTEPGFVMPVAGDTTDTTLRIGDSFPILESVDIDGNAVTLDEHLLGERYTLIVFWSTWCGICMHELPQEVELANRYRASGLKVIGVNADETRATARAAAQEYDIPWLNLHEGSERHISHDLGIRLWPALLLLDGDGKVVATTESLRTISGETSPDGSFRQINGLEWTLRKLLPE